MIINLIHIRKRVLSLLALWSLLFTFLPLNAETLSYPIVEKKGKQYYAYQVPKSIGLYRISVNFGVPQEEIIAANPELKKRGLQLGEIIYIPVKEEPVEAVVEPAQPLEAEGETTATDEVPATDVAEHHPTVLTGDVLRLGLLLPLHVNATERTQAMDRFMDFYEGSLAAVYDVQASGQQIELHVYDIEKGTNSITDLIEAGSLAGLNGILGPAYPLQVSALADYVHEQKILTLIPFTDRVPQLETNPYLMQFNLSATDESVFLADYIARDTLINTVFIAADEQDIPESVRTLKQQLLSRGTSVTTTTVHEILVDSIALSLKAGMENILVFNTEKFANISVLMPHLLLTGGKSLTLHTQYSWQKERILLPQIYTTEFATEFPADMTHYNELYARYFGHEHASSDPRYDLLGYDLMRTLISHLCGKEYKGLQSDAVLVRMSSTGGYKNSNVRVVRK